MLIDSIVFWNIYSDTGAMSFQMIKRRERCVTVFVNILEFTASFLMLAAGYYKSKKKCLVIQAVQLSLVVITMLILGAFSSVIVNIISIIRNILTHYGKLSIKIKIIMNIIIFIIISTYARNIIDYFPFGAFFIYTIVLDKVSDIQFKWLNNIVMILWTTYDFTFHAYVFFVFDIAYIIINNIVLRKMYVEKRNNEKP